MNKQHKLTIGSEKRIVVEISPVKKQITKLFLFFGFSGATLFSCGSAYAVSLVNSKVYSNAYINILSGDPDEHTATGLNPSVQSFAQVNGATASASATGTSLKVKAESDGNGTSLSFPAVANTFFRNSYQLLGHTSNTGVPLTFDFNLTGKLSNTTPVYIPDTPLNTFGVASVSFDYQLVNYDFDRGSYSETKGGAYITAQSGVDPIYGQYGNLGNNKFSGVTLTPTLDPKLTRTIPPDLKKISYGVDPGFGINASYTFDSELQLTETIIDNGRLDGYFYAYASSTPNASGLSDFHDTLKLTSITVPQTYDGLDLDSLKVAFDSGDVIPVTRAVSTELPSKPVPEPLTYLGTSVALAIGWLMKRKYKSVQCSVSKLV